MARDDTQVEKAIDRRVQRRLATDRAYLNAENAEEQTAAEERITALVERELGLGICTYCRSAITRAADGAWEDSSGACGCGDGEHEPWTGSALDVMLDDFDAASRGA